VGEEKDFSCTLVVSVWSYSFPSSASPSLNKIMNRLRSKGTLPLILGKEQKVASDFIVMNFDTRK
jgi:hypothetical protein